MAKPNHQAWAAIFATDRLVCIQTHSGLRRTASDPKGRTELVPVGAEPAALGVALAAALSASRVLASKEIGPFFNLAALGARYEQWVELLLKAHPGATRRSLFRGMRHCYARVSEGVVELRPTRQEKLEAWSGLGVTEEDRVRIELAASPQALGEAVLLALGRCTGL
jgi:hypothetical protein